MKSSTLKKKATAVAKVASSKTAKKRPTMKRAASTGFDTKAIQKLLSTATPYALPGAGALATAGLAATGFFLRKEIASFARGKAGAGTDEVLRMLNLERRSMHVLGAAGMLAGGLALGCIAGFFLGPRLLAAMARTDHTNIARPVNTITTDGATVARTPPNNGTAQRSS